MRVFLQGNGYIEHKIRKDFLPRLLGTFERAGQLANVIVNARIKQRYLFASLLDLKDAFGEVHHNLVPEILRYHRIPDHIEQRILSIYSNFQTSMVANSFQTPFITLGCGEL